MGEIGGDSDQRYIIALRAPGGSWDSSDRTAAPTSSTDFCISGSLVLPSSRHTDQPNVHRWTVQEHDTGNHANMSANIVDQGPMDGPDRVGPDYSPKRTKKESLRRIVKAFTTKQGLIGSYDYGKQKPYNPRQLTRPNWDTQLSSSSQIFPS